MASATLTPYRNNANQVTFSLVSTSADQTTYKVSGNPLSEPHLVEITRKLTNSNSASNDHVQVRIARVERNATTGKLATMQVLCDISLPKDDSILTATVQKEQLAILASLFNEATAMEATTANITALIEGRDL